MSFLCYWYNALIISDSFLGTDWLIRIYPPIRYHDLGSLPNTLSNSTHTHTVKPCHSPVTISVLYSRAVHYQKVSFQKPSLYSPVTFTKSTLRSPFLSINRESTEAFQSAVRTEPWELDTTDGRAFYRRSHLSAFQGRCHGRSLIGPACHCRG